MLSPHVRAAQCSIAAASIVREAAERAGAPPGLIQWIDKPSLALATALMKDPKINLILATGGLAATCRACSTQAVLGAGRRAWCLTAHCIQLRRTIHQLHVALALTLLSFTLLPPTRQVAPAW